VLLGQKLGSPSAACGLNVAVTMNDATAPHRAGSRRAGSVLGILAAFLFLAIVILVLLGKVHRLNSKLQQGPDTQRQLDQAKSDVAQAKAELEKASAAPAALQAQLDKAKGQQAALQSQVDQLKGASEQHQLKLDEARAQSAELQAQLDRVKVQLGVLQAQLSQAASRSSQLLAQLDQEKARSLDLQSQLQKTKGDIAQLQPVVEKARHMPIKTSFEKILGGPFEIVSAARSLTLHVNNLYLEPLSVDIAITSAGNTRSLSRTIEAGATLNIEKLADGDTVVISSEGYDPVSLTAE
jgi:DNA repair exonuclease SbcCD ATPase subunit